MSNQLHIVCLDAPSPPDYGGVLDLHHKIPALAGLGFEIILHYFQYKKGRGAAGLEKYCTSIHHYNRSSFFSPSVLALPFIVRSRTKQELIDRLNQDDHPVLLEGVHCTGVLPYISADRKVVVRMHNDEAAYYHYLAQHETNPVKKIYYTWESRLLQHYQAMLPPQHQYSFVSEQDLNAFKKKYGLKKTSYIPPFIPWQTVDAKAGKGSYCLYHGNLSVSENEKAASWLLQNVFSGIKVPFIIAGKNCPDKLRRLIKNSKGVRLFDNPSAAEMEGLIADAHIHILPSFNSTGIKLKLLHALFAGRFCITNKAGIEGSNLNKSPYLAETPEMYKETISNLMKREFTAHEIRERSHRLSHYNNTENAQKLSALLYSHYQ